MHTCRQWTRLCLITCLYLVFGAGRWAEAEVARGRRGMVASVHPIATQAGLNAFKQGGNAIDAAIATALTLGVVDIHNSGIGGGCFILIRTADGRLTAIDGREMAPAKAHREMFIRNGKADPKLSQIGPLASGVPGAVAAYHRAISRHGKLKWPALVKPAAAIAERGFPVDRTLARMLRSKRQDLLKFAATKAALFKPDGQAYREGETLKRPDLAKTYRGIARQGPKWFYEGPFAEAVDKWMAVHGGIMTAEDLNNYRVKMRQPLVTTYRGFTIVGFPPPSSGGIHVAQILNTVEHFDLKSLYQKDRARFVHVIAEAMKPAFADRTFWLGDPEYTRVPRELVAKTYAAQLAQRINRDRATKVTSHGQPPAATTNVFGKHTTHIATADSQGNWVAITQTINTSFGSKVVIPGTGVVMNNEMDDFAAQPGVPNHFGLLGAEANAVAPGKRPLSSMSPTIVLRDGEPIMTVGAAGGPKIITGVLLALIRRLDLGQSAGEVVAAPRFHHQWIPDQLHLESSFPKSIDEELRGLGHQLKRSSVAGVMQAITRSQGRDGKIFEGASDPRVPGSAAGY